MSALLIGYAAFVATSISPGPSVLAIMATSLAHGRAAGLRFALGVVAGSCIWGVLAASGVTAALAAAAWTLSALKIAGALYLLWLAWKSARAAASSAPRAMPSQSREPGRFFARGVALHLTNPKAILGWASIVALGLPPGAGPAEIVLLLSGCAVLSLAINLGYALAFALPPVARAYRAARRLVEAAFAGLFATAAVGLLAWRP
ncbi:MAG: LysE family translocator [Pseudomonadota bacterium]